MTWDQPCEHEEAVRLMSRRLARGLDVDEGVREHAAACLQCQETLTIGHWMLRLAASSVSTAPLPDPQYLWWKAELLRRWQAEQRASSAIDKGEHMQVGVGLAAAAGLLLWLWRAIVPLGFDSSTVTLAMISSGVLIVGAAGVLVRNVVVRS